MSNFDCLGFAVGTVEELDRLVEELLPLAEPIGAGRNGTEVLRWQDGSGARLVMGMRKGNVEYLTPSFAGAPGAHLDNVVDRNRECSSASVMDASGEEATHLAVDVEQRALIGGMTVSGAASIVALAAEASLHENAAAFAESPASLMSSGADPDSEPPAFYVAQGWPWPPRMAPESFIASGLFEEERPTRPTAILIGTVLEADLRTNSHSGRTFVRARVRTVGFEADVCAPAYQLPKVPESGEVLATTSYLVASIDSWRVDAGGRRGLLARVLGRGA